MIFNVFGEKVVVKKVNHQWQLFAYSDAGIGRRIFDVVIPEDMAEEEFANFLDDIYHERATVKHPVVTRLD